jgi:hypothetical protein
VTGSSSESSVQAKRLQAPVIDHGVAAQAPRLIDSQVKIRSSEDAGRGVGVPNARKA